MGKATFILVLGSLILFSIYIANMNNYVLRGSDVMFDRYSEVQAKQLASSVVNMLLTELAEYSAFRTTRTEKISILNETAEYRVIDTILVVPDTLIMIDVRANVDGQAYSVKAYTSKTRGWVPPSVRGAWTANADLNNTISDMYIDGRDHNLDGTINPGTGNFAISSASNFTNVDNAAIGGTYLGIDYPMTFPHLDIVIEQNVDWGGAFPSSPDEILGYPEGTLKSIAMSGEGDSQYILNPPEMKVGKKKFMQLEHYPISGVTYIEITNGIDYEFLFQGNENSGILVINAPGSNDSRVKGVKFNADNCEGVFTGLMVTDYSFHHHIDIIGAVLQLSPDLEDEKNCNGNADHYVYYSTQVLKGSTAFVAEQVGDAGNTGAAAQIGIGRKKALLWYEYKNL